MQDSKLVFGITLMIGLVLSGYLISDGIKSIRLSNRYVTVKGLSEKTVQADMAAWNISFVSQANSFKLAIEKNKKNMQKLIAYLKNSKLTDKEFEIGTPRVQKNENYRKDAGTIVKYEIQHSILIKSNNVALIKNIASHSTEILQLGIQLSGWDAPSYYYTSLNSIKPEMIAEATVNARKAAEKFAQDSQSTLGKLRKARQGPFSFHGIAQIMRETRQIQKVVRVVITAEYMLVD